MSHICDKLIALSFLGTFPYCIARISQQISEFEVLIAKLQL
jgi:hypothetical protein